MGSKQRVHLTDGKTLDISIPEGTEDGQTLRLKGQGMAGLGGSAAGDAYVKIDVRDHPYFERHGADIRLEVPITLHEALSGASVTVPTVHGKVTMIVPAGANTGTVLRLKGKGVVDRATGLAGNQYVTLKVMLPEKPDATLKEFVEEWTAKHPYDPRKKAGLT